MSRTAVLSPSNSRNIPWADILPRATRELVHRSVGRVASLASIRGVGYEPQLVLDEAAAAARDVANLTVASGQYEHGSRWAVGAALGGAALGFLLPPAAPLLWTAAGASLVAGGGLNFIAVQLNGTSLELEREVSAAYHSPNLLPNHR